MTGGWTGLRFDGIGADPAMDDPRWYLDSLDPVDHPSSGEKPSADDGMCHAQPHPAADAYGHRRSRFASCGAVVAGHGSHPRPWRLIPAATALSQPAENLTVITI
jgi:hypothetical protein